MHKAGAQIEHPGSLDSPPRSPANHFDRCSLHPTKLREVALLTELLQPPVALDVRGGSAEGPAI